MSADPKKNKKPTPKPTSTTLHILCTSLSRVLYSVTIKTTVGIYNVSPEFPTIAVFNDHAHSKNFVIIVFIVNDSI